jgi:glycine/D-amino acid oxidase-like deaminating enzyme
VVVNAAGPWAAEVGRWTGIDIPIVNRSRTILVTGPFAAIPPDRPFVEDISADWYYRPEGDGVLMGMGLEPVDNLSDPPTDPALVDRMIDAAVHRVPALEHASVHTTWTGVRPLTPDGLPVLGAAPAVDGLILNCGWGGLGIIMAPIAGVVAAEIIGRGRGETVDCGPLSLVRFA